jgi:soluble P-type ATPase
MIEINIPDFGTLSLEHLVLDYNGTLAGDGSLLNGVSPLLERLSAHLQIHILSADTYGTVRKMFAGLPYTVFVLPAGSEDKGKVGYVQQLGSRSTVCIGNGRNDRFMLKEAALGIAVMQREGASLEALLSADIVIPDVFAALELLLYPRRLIATLRC